MKCTLKIGNTEIEIPEEMAKTLEESIVKPLPKAWEELKKINGFYTANGKVSKALQPVLPIICNRDTFVTRKQAEAAIALAQLTQILKVYNDGWVPNWNDPRAKYSIYYYSNNICTCTYSATPQLLAFKTTEEANEFMNTFQKLIKQAAPLLWGIEL